jgi:hypothetical protein
MKNLIHCLVLLSGSIYCQNTVKIGEQIWMTENLDVTQFRNGDPIPQAQTDDEWQEAGFNGKPAWCYVTVANEEGVKQELKQYCIDHELMQYVVEDETNTVIKGSRRNFVRNKVLPMLHQENIHLKKTVAKKMHNKLKQFTNETSENTKTS